MTNSEKTERKLRREVAALRRKVRELKSSAAEGSPGDDALRTSERRLRSIYSAMNEGVALHEIVYDESGKPADYRIVDMNPSFESIVGLTREQATGRNASDLYGTGEAPFLDTYARTAATGEPASFETYFPPMRKHFSISVFSPAEGQFGTVFADISERKRAEESVRNSEERLRVLFEYAPDGCYLNDLTGTFLDGNRAAEELTGYKREELIGRSFARLGLLPPKQIPKAIALLAKNAMGKQTGPDEFVLRRKDGSEVTAEIRTYPVIIEGRKLVLGIARDITDRRRAEKEREEMQAQLLQAQKMEAVGTLAAGIAHDFNNLLTAIHGYCDLAIMTADDADPVQPELASIRRAASRASVLTRQLLLFSRKQPMEFAALDIDRMIDDLLRMLRRLLGEDIVVNVDLDSGLWSVQADQGSIEQVIVNLAVNARDAMPDGGTLTIRTRRCTLDGTECETMPDARPGRYIHLSATDTGIGMDEEVSRHIFEPFFTTKTSGKGTGLGLSVVYGIVKEHSGWITAESAPGRGAVFDVYLPASATRVAPDARPATSLRGLAGSGERVLLVEDEEGPRELAARVLGDNGYVVVSAASAAEALDLFDREDAAFDLVLSDVVLPDVNGIQLIDQLLPRKPGLKALLTSGYTDSRSQWPIIREKGLRFIPKPYSLPDLLRAVRDTMQSKAAGARAEP